MQYSVASAKNNLPKLLQAVTRGESVVITKRGEPIAELVRVRPKEAPKKGFGCAPGLTATLPAGWDSEEEENKYAAHFESLE